MKRLNHGIKWTMAAVLIAGIMAVPAFAEKTTPATGKNSAVPAVPRAIPDLLPYHKFDPPKSKLFDISKLTISGDLRVRPEFRTNTGFGGGRTKEQHLCGAAMGAVGLQLLDFAGRDVLLPGPTFQELGCQWWATGPDAVSTRMEPTAPSLPGRRSCWCGTSWCRTSPSKPGGNWWSGATIACSGISTGTTWDGPTTG